MKRLVALLACCASCATTPPVPTASTNAVDYAAIVAAPDRLPTDIALDAGRKPAAFLEFAGVQPGMAVGEMGAGGGYTAELLARTVGQTGTVYGQNNKFFLEKFAEKPWSERLTRPTMKNVVRVDREFDDPFPSDIKPLDVVVFNAVYHDTVWQKTDRAQMNRKVFEALKPGGHYIVIDSSAAAGAGLTVVQTLHRIEESTVRQEVEAAGFKLETTSDFLRNPEDARDWSASPGTAGAKRGTGDRFALRFVKPG